MPIQDWKPKAILFDLLTALTDSWSLWNVAAGSSSLGMQWRKAYLEVTYGCGVYRPYEDLVLESARQAGLSDPEGATEKLVQVWGTLQPWPETMEVLQKLESSLQGVKMGVVTNCSTELGRRAAGCLGWRWDVVITAEEAGVYKPDQRAYVRALEELGVEAGETLFVAGSASDVPGAAGVGMKVVWHNRVGLARKGDVEIALREGKTLVDALGEWL